MLYCVYGFNFFCDQIINKYQNYSSYIIEKLPVIKIEENDDFDTEMSGQVEIKNSFCVSSYSSQKSIFRFGDGKSILITPDRIQFGGQKIDDKLLGGADIIVLSRLHGRAVLHGSAFQYGEKAYLLCAFPGAGKSTLSTAMSKYHENITHLTDDIICVEETGEIMYRGLAQIGLNNDSCNYLFSEKNNNLTVLSSKVSDDSKTIYEIKPNYSPIANVGVKIGGIFFLQNPIDDDLIKIKELGTFDLFCEAIKNIKLRCSLVDGLLSQEMQVIENMISKNIFGAKLWIKHNYSDLEEITKRIVGYIDKQIEK